jgi:cysteine synthase
MADMPAYDPDSHLNDGEDEFADELAGNVYAMSKSPGTAGTRHGLYGIAQTQLLNLADSGKTELVRNIAGVVGMIRTVAKQVEGFGVEPYAGYARQATSLVDELHDSIAEKSVEELIEDGRALVRQQPEIAIAAAVIAGFLGARLLKARS